MGWIVISAGMVWLTTLGWVWGQVHGQMPPPHDVAAAQAVLDLVKKAKAELGMEVEIDEDLVRHHHPPAPPSCIHTAPHRPRSPPHTTTYRARGRWGGRVRGRWRCGMSTWPLAPISPRAALRLQSPSPNF